MSTCSGIANLHNAFDVLKHRKRILLVSVLLVVAVGLVLILRPRNEPQYQGRYLSEWMEDYALSPANVSKRETAKQAVKAIGTNAVPIFVNWLSAETPSWKIFWRRKLPRRITQHKSVADFLGGEEEKRVALGMRGIFILGPKAASAIPDLNSLMQNRTNTLAVINAIQALTAIGGKSVPVLGAALADPKQQQRRAILWSLRQLYFTGYAQECTPFINAALEDPDVNVRSKATNVLQATTFKDLLKLPRE